MRAVDAVHAMDTPPAAMKAPALPGPAGPVGPFRHGWCLRFLDGAARGRTIALERGRNLVGSAPDCGVMLAGGAIQAQHLVLQVGDITVTLQPVGHAQVFLNGEAVNQLRRSLAPGDEITVGDHLLQLDRSSHATTTDETSGFPESILCADSTVVHAPMPTVPARTGAPARAGAVLAACGAVALAGVAFWPGAEAEQPSSRGPDATLVRQVIAGFDEVEAIAVPGSLVELRGYVPTRARRSALQEAVAPFGRQVTINVHAVDELLEQARRYVADPGVALNYRGRGRIVLTGTSDDASLRRRIRQLAEDLQPAVHVTDRLHYRHDDAASGSQANAAGQAAQLAERAQWAAWQTQLPSRIVSMTIDGNGARFLQLANGSRYYEGALLRSGERLERVGSRPVPTPTPDPERRHDLR